MAQLSHRYVCRFDVSWQPSHQFSCKFGIVISLRIARIRECIPRVALVLGTKTWTLETLAVAEVMAGRGFNIISPPLVFFVLLNCWVLARVSLNLIVERKPNSQLLPFKS